MRMRLYTEDKKPDRESKRSYALDFLSILTLAGWFYYLFALSPIGG